MMPAVIAGGPSPGLAMSGSALILIYIIRDYRTMMTLAMMIKGAKGL